jgi:hypothetical protein
MAILQLIRLASGWRVLTKWPSNGDCAVSSVVEHYLDTVGVTGSNPVSRTIFAKSWAASVKMSKLIARSELLSLGMFSFMRTARPTPAGIAQRGRVFPSRPEPHPFSRTRNHARRWRILGHDTGMRTKKAGFFQISPATKPKRNREKVRPYFCGGRCQSVSAA